MLTAMSDHAEHFPSDLRVACVCGQVLAVMVPGRERWSLYLQDRPTAKHSRTTAHVDHLKGGQVPGIGVEATPAPRPGITDGPDLWETTKPGRSVRLVCRDRACSRRRDGAATPRTYTLKRWRLDAAADEALAAGVETVRVLGDHLEVDRGWRLPETEGPRPKAAAAAGPLPLRPRHH